MIAYNVKDWFWLIGTAPVQVYSSRLGAYLDFSHPDYIAFLADAGITTKIDTEGNLADVLKSGELLNWYECYTNLTVKAQQIQVQLTQAVQNHLDSKAQEMGYDSIFTACTYEGDLNPVWSAEGAAYKAWRSAVWQYCLQVLTDVQNQLRPIPTEAELLAELPVFGGV